MIFIFFAVKIQIVPSMVNVGLEIL